MSGRAIGTSRGVGFLGGFAVAMVAVLSWRIPAGTGELGADVSVIAVPSGELKVSTTGPFLVSSGMLPGSAARGSVDVLNDTGSDLHITVSAEPSITDLDDLLWVELDAGGRDFFRGSLAELRRGTTNGFDLRPGRVATLGVRCWLPTSSDGGYQGRIDDLALTFDAKVAGPP
jgi:hypothetical protein